MSINIFKSYILQLYLNKETCFSGNKGKFFRVAIQYKSVHLYMFCEKDIFRNLQNRKIHQINFIKKATLAQMFSYDF